MQRTALYYLIIVGLAALGLFLILRAGDRTYGQVSPFKASSAIATGQPGVTPTEGHSFATHLRESAADPLSRFFLQLFAVITVSYSFGWLLTRYGQPAVVGEMLAGIVLGPSLFGLIFPGAFQFVFAASALEPLRLLSQVGVCLFMFAVGMETEWAELRRKALTAVFVSHASIAVPGLLGAGLAFLFYERLAQPGAPFIQFALFVSVSMSITAFPVLVRILQDRGILKTSLGRLAAACAAVGDATAWGLLALLVAFVKASDFSGAAMCLELVLVFAGVMFFVIKPWLPRWLGDEALAKAKPPKSLLAIVMAIVLASAFCTQLLGIHALFGAFVAGLIMPTEHDFRAKLGVRLENISTVLLLPVFFASSGLRTEIGLLHGRTDWLICLLIIALATFGKLGGTSVAARLTGMKWGQSLPLGALMNTRGLMELIALNLGYELHILSQQAFSMLVLMAVITTIMTGPLLTLFGSHQAKRLAPVEPLP